VDSTIRAGVFTEKATCALLFIDSKIAIPGKSVDRTHIDTRLRFTGKTKIDFFLFRPIGLNANSRLFGCDGPFVGKGADDLTDSATGT
jgi:hypothetical protein